MRLQTCARSSGAADRVERPRRGGCARSWSDRRSGPGSSMHPESGYSPTSDSPSPSESPALGGEPAGQGDGREPPRYVHLRATSSRCQRRMVSGVTMVTTCARRRRPRRCPNSARRRRSGSSNRSRRPASRVFKTRFSSRRNAMTSACSRWSQPPKAAISNWNGSTPEVYAHCSRSACGTLRD